MTWTLHVNGVTYCRSCYKPINRKPLETCPFPEHKRSYASQRARMKTWYKTVKGKLSQRRGHLQRKFGLKLNDYERLVLQQKGLCAICAERLPLVVDHNHTTTQVRGLLCRPCNTFVGLMESHPQRLTAALAYLGWYPR